jgi:predicted nucleic acid-binding protein
VIVPDASVWVSVILNQDVDHVVSRQWTRQWSMAGRLLVVPVLFLAGVAGAVSRRSGSSALGRRELSAILTNLAIRLEAVDRPLAESAARHAADLPLKGSDAVYVALAERMGIPLITWDNEQLAQGAAVIDVRTPTI